MAKKKVKSMIPNVSYDPALEKMSCEEAGDSDVKKKKAPVKQKVAPVKEKKKSFWSRFKPRKVEKQKAKKRNIMNIKKLQEDTPTGIKKSKKIPDWQGPKKLTKKQQAARTAAYKSPMTRMEKSAAKKSKKDFRTGTSKADVYAPVDQSKRPKPGASVTRKDTTVKTKGGDYPVYRKDTTSSKSFSKSFAAARKAGKKTFEWQGRKYSTARADDKKQMGGPVDDRPFKKGVKYYESGGQVTTSNDKAGVGDIAHVHSNSGSNYKAGE